MNGLEYIQNQIARLKDDYQHYTMVEEDKVLANQVGYDLGNLYQIEKELKDGEKYKKAIEIIKGKGTYMVEIISAVCYYKTYDELLGDACPWCSNRDLSREEFDLLKEVLK